MSETKLKMELDLDSIWTGDEWGTTLGEILKDEIKTVVRSEIKKSLRENSDLKQAIAALRRRAAQKIIDELVG